MIYMKLILWIIYCKLLLFIAISLTHLFFNSPLESACNKIFPIAVASTGPAYTEYSDN